MEKNNITNSNLLKGEVYAGVISMARKTIGIKVSKGDEFPKFTPLAKVGDDYKPVVPTETGAAGEVVGISLTYIPEQTQNTTISCEILTGNCAICSDYIDYSIGNWTKEHKKKLIEQLEKLNFKMVKEV